MTPSLLQRILSVWRYNCFAHHNEDSLVLYNMLSMCAHSCDPSACWSFGDDDSCVLRARREIKAGEEITVSYLHDDILKATVVRRRKLSNWDFLCACERCMEIIDYARGFRCKKCHAGSCYFAGEGCLTKCNMCDFTYTPDEIERLVETEKSVVDRVDLIKKHDTVKNAEMIYVDAVTTFTEHWCLYVLDTILFEYYRDQKNFFAASEHQQRRITFHTKVFPRVTFILAWAYEELADILQCIGDENSMRRLGDWEPCIGDENSIRRHGSVTVWLAHYWQARYMLSILCGPTHAYTESVEEKWHALRAQTGRDQESSSCSSDSDECLA